ncbi:MAG: hypothetical protein IT364_25400 [Candidatus Hydrogenedentes bacterium]|nr:hypothetical protein [Candidatus Hydrogenedentota bacterium]
MHHEVDFARYRGMRVVQILDAAKRYGEEFTPGPIGGTTPGGWKTRKGAS